MVQLLVVTRGEYVVSSAEMNVVFEFASRMLEVSSHPELESPESLMSEKNGVMAVLDAFVGTQ